MKKRMVIAVVFFIMALISQVGAHEGHDATPMDADVGGQGNNVILSDATIKNLGIETISANLAPLEKTLQLNASIEYLPENYANITPRASGSIRTFKAKLGDFVKKGQELSSFSPVFVGSTDVVLRSPINGFVVKQHVVIGQAITPETVVMEIADISKLLVKGIIYSANNFAQIKVGQQVNIISANIAAPLSGVVQRIDMGSNKENQTFSVYALVNNPHHNMLFPHSAATMSIILEKGHEALTVPAKAILGEMGNYFVFVREGNNFERRSVVLGQKMVERVEIIEGVLPDEEVVVVGNYQLQYAKTSQEKH